MTEFTDYMIGDRIFNIKHYDPGEEPLDSHRYGVVGHYCFDYPESYYIDWDDGTRSIMSAFHMRPTTIQKGDY